jgi:hypothetical protein
MLQSENHSRTVTKGSDSLSSMAAEFTHPDDVLHSRMISLADKRAILAAWASDAHVVPNLPAMRQLDSGAIVDIDTVLAALRALDAPGIRAKSTQAEGGSWARPRISLWRRAPRGDNNDDDDPPPCPAAAIPPGVELELRRRRDQAWGLAAA